MANMNLAAFARCARLPTSGAMHATCWCCALCRVRSTESLTWNGTRRVEAGGGECLLECMWDQGSGGWDKFGDRPRSRSYGQDFAGADGHGGKRGDAAGPDQALPSEVRCFFICSRRYHSLVTALATTRRSWDEDASEDGSNICPHSME
jgi:hypothetical protein